DSVVKERFDGTEGLNRGRAFYAANPACQALAERFFRFSSVAYHRNPDQPDLAAGGESYSVNTNCQPRLDQQPASSGRTLPAPPCQPVELNSAAALHWKWRAL